ncbi:MAG: hypothetical protein M1825_004443 [Sarcosagium campestre]|nr:MAG: hypothetical protein M1825_004443 [Sarcosagium campestre]
MADYGERPWSESEKIYLLAEILKGAGLRTEILLNFINVEGIEPRWEDTPLPHGRSLRSCQNAFHGLRALHSASAYTAVTSAAPSPLSYQAVASEQINPRKRPLSIKEQSSPAGRTLQPRPPAFSPLNGPVYQPVPAEDLSQPPKKKRGRPSKAEAEFRAAEAAARGEPYPPRRSPKTPKRPKQADTAVASMSVEDLAPGIVAGATATPATPAEAQVSNTTVPATTETGSGVKRKRPQHSESEADQTHVPVVEALRPDEAVTQPRPREDPHPAKREDDTRVQASSRVVQDSQQGDTRESDSPMTLVAQSGEQTRA